VVAAKTTVPPQRQSRSRRAGANVGGRRGRRRRWQPLVVRRRRALVVERVRALVVGLGLALVVELGHALVLGLGRGARRDPAVPALLLPAETEGAPALVVPIERCVCAAAVARRLVPLSAGGGGGVQSCRFRVRRSGRDDPHAEGQVRHHKQSEAGCRPSQEAGAQAKGTDRPSGRRRGARCLPPTASIQSTRARPVPKRRRGGATSRRLQRRGHQHRGHACRNGQGRERLAWSRVGSVAPATRRERERRESE